MMQRNSQTSRYAVAISFMLASTLTASGSDTAIYHSDSSSSVTMTRQSPNEGPTCRLDAQLLAGTRNHSLSLVLPLSPETGDITLGLLTLILGERETSLGATSPWVTYELKWGDEGAFELTGSPWVDEGGLQSVLLSRTLSGDQSQILLRNLLGAEQIAVLNSDGETKLTFTEISDLWEPLQTCLRDFGKPQD